MEKKKKVVFQDAGKDKVAIGVVTFDNDFVVVTNDVGRTIYINKDHVILIKDGDY